jgi:hypothetical protein
LKVGIVVSCLYQKVVTRRPSKTTGRQGTAEACPATGGERVAVNLHVSSAAPVSTRGDLTNLPAPTGRNYGFPFGTRLLHFGA